MKNIKKTQTQQIIFNTYVLLIFEYTTSIVISKLIKVLYNYPQGYLIIGSSDGYVFIVLQISFNLVAVRVHRKFY